ncbi:MAG: CoB--CoM heterodisulfide reductase subunit C [Methanobrevibacter sp.]|uniref:CoB--CoM heterodisulfide reductase subunit C n=1 Tax=Methanobrevibacter sp. TaxID=66852 RepID=UPI0025D87676|nr:CoB--CoM heterodisulfide reductase subunit C [Methanobrevibacter sp.]MBQ6098460.1 CoB--CoM heterodisulfide reductase subunit C [Methanobrevibacter sp.]
MSIINRLKSLFKGDNDTEEKDISNDVSNTSDDVQVTSSQAVQDDIVSGTKTTVPRDDVVKSEPETDEKDLTFKSDIETLEEDAPEEAAEEIVEEAEETPEETEVEAPQEAEVEVAEEEAPAEEVVEQEEETSEENVEEAKEDLNKKDTKRDTMTLLTDKELLTDSNRDPDFTAEFIDAGIETVKHCFQCGTCSGGCPSGRRTPYKVRQIVRKCLLGLKEEVITDDALWMCTTCYTCQERCLRSVKIVEIIKKARNIAAHAGYMAKPHKMTGVFVMNTGHGVPINDATKALRTKIGLSEIPPTTHAFPEALEEVQKLCKITGFDELIGYDEATGGLKE